MRFLLVALAACESTATPTPTPPPTPIVPTPADAAPAPPPPTGPQFVAEIGKTLRWFTVEGTTVRQFGSVDLPSGIRTLGWANHQPVMMFEDHRIATATPTSLDFVTLPAASAWPQPNPMPAKATALSPPDIRLKTKNNEIWVGRCEWLDSTGYAPICAAWVDARIRPTPILIETSYGEFFGPPREPAHPAPAIAPPTSIKAKLVPDLVRHKGKRDKLVCTDGKVTIEDPPVGTPLEPAFDNPTAHGRTDLVWLSADPPIFELGDHDNCGPPCPTRVIFQRCKRSQRYNSVDVGPENILAFTGDDNNAPKKSYAWNVMIFRDGRELATVSHVTEFAWVP